MLRTVSFVLSCVALSLCGGCGDKNAWSGAVPNADFAVFEKNVYPVLLRDCAFAACHGGEHRFFQVYGPGRTRLPPLPMPKQIFPDEVPSRDEIMRSYERATAMLAGADRVENSLLLKKPLEASRGGQGHKGVDNYGRNVYSSKLDPDYLVLLSWAHSAQANAQALTTADAGEPTP